MRYHLLPTALATAVLVAAFSGVASARLSSEGVSDTLAPAPMRTPAAIPIEDAAHPGSYGFQSSETIAATFDTDAPAASNPAGAAATITVTATVLPVVFVVFDDSGAVVKLVTNSLDRDANGVLFLPRSDSETGDAVKLDADGWAAARAALAAAHEGTGTIWSV